MLRSLWFKFLAVLVTVVAVGLSATFLLRDLMVQDFIVFLEQESEERVNWLTASLEGSFERHLDWNNKDVSESLSWAAMMGIETRLYNNDGELLMDTDKAIERLPFFVQKRVRDIAGEREAVGNFKSHGILIGGAEIGRLEVLFHTPGKETQYIKRSNRFLLLSVAVLGSVALILSFVFSTRLTKPVKELTEASSALASGDFTKRVSEEGKDEISQLARSFNRMAEQLAKQDELRKKLTANVAHELRTPLGAVRGELEGMIDGLIPSDKDNLRSVYDEIGRMRIVLDGMEEVAQAEASGLTLNLKRFDLSQFMSDITERYRRMFNEQQVELELDMKKGLQVFADPERLSQVYINLLSNALKATKKGGHVVVKTDVTSDKSTIIKVTDDGVGIDGEHLPFIFERFYRAREGGLGIGLTIVKELIEAHGGVVEVKSFLDQGSVFTVILPS
jgi:two-component system sensor histidine kinase BaeS